MGNKDACCTQRNGNVSTKVISRQRWSFQGDPWKWGRRGNDQSCLWPQVKAFEKLLADLKGAEKDSDWPSDDLSVKTESRIDFVEESTTLVKPVKV